MELKENSREQYLMSNMSTQANVVDYLLVCPPNYDSLFKAFANKQMALVFCSY